MTDLSQRIGQQALGSHETVGSAGAGRRPQQPGGPHGVGGTPPSLTPTRCSGPADFSLSTLLPFLPISMILLFSWERKFCEDGMPWDDITL